MANLKIRGVRESATAEGPQNGPGQSMDFGSETIPNTAHEGNETKYPTTAPCYQPNSSLGAKQIAHTRPGKKALGG